MDIKVSSFIPNGHINIPSSKSYTHRAFIAAFIANKGATIKNVNFCDDTNCTLSALKALGANFKINNNTVEFFARNKTPENIIINVNDSASSLRMLLPIASYLCPHIKFVGSEKLFSRSLETYLEILNDQNIKYILTSSSIEIFSSIKDSDLIIDNLISSQFVSGWLFLLSLANSSHFVKINTKLESSSYIDMTLDILTKFGSKFIKQNNIYIHSFSLFNYLNYEIEKDFSQMAFFAVLSSLKGNISFSNMNLDSLQGDKQIINILIDAGAKVDFLGNTITFFHSILKGTEIDISNCIDLGPILFVMASFCLGTTKIINTKRLSYKESNRLLAMKEELQKANVDITLLDNEVIINGKAKYKGDFNFNSHNDHRVCMALSIFSIISGNNCTISNYEVINKSYPNFFNDLFSLNKEAI